MAHGGFVKGDDWMRERRKMDITQGVFGKFGGGRVVDWRLENVLCREVVTRENGIGGEGIFFFWKKSRNFNLSFS